MHQVPTQMAAFPLSQEHAVLSRLFAVDGLARDWLSPADVFQLLGKLLQIEEGIGQVGDLIDLLALRQLLSVNLVSPFERLSLKQLNGAFAHRAILH